MTETIFYTCECCKKTFRKKKECETHEPLCFERKRKSDDANKRIFDFLKSIELEGAKIDVKYSTTFDTEDNIINTRFN